MAQVRLFKFGSEGFPIEHDTAADDITFNSLTLTGGQLDVGSAKIVNVAAGTAATDGVNFQQLEDISGGLDWKESVRAKSDGGYSTWTGGGPSGVGHTLTSPNDNVSNNDFDGVTLAVNDRVLITGAGGDDSTADVENGIYTMTTLADGAGQSAVLTRATDQDEDDEYSAGNTVHVSEGTTYSGQKWSVVTADPITVDTTAVQWSQTGSAANADEAQRIVTGYITDGTGVTKGDPVYVSGNNIVSSADAATPSEARRYIGLAAATVGASLPVDIVAAGVLTAVTVAGSPAGGDLVFLADGGGLVDNQGGLGSGDAVLVVGKMKNATDIDTTHAQYNGTKA